MGLLDWLNNPNGGLEGSIMHWLTGGSQHANAQQAAPGQNGYQYSEPQGDTMIGYQPQQSSGGAYDPSSMFQQQGIGSTQDGASLIALLRQMGKGAGGYNAGAPYDSQINELRRQLAMAQGLNNQGKSDVNVGYDALQKYWQNDVPKAFKGIYNGAVADTGKAATKLKAAIKGNYDAATADTANQMAKFGINTGAQGQAQAAQIAGKNAGEQANLQGLADSRNAANSDFFNKLNASAGNFATEAAGLTGQDKERALGELRQQLYNTTMDTQGKISDLGRERAAAIQQANMQNMNNRAGALEKLVQLEMGPNLADRIALAKNQMELQTLQAGKGGGAALDFLQNAARNPQTGQEDTAKLQDLLNEFNYMTSGGFKNDLAKNLGYTKDSKFNIEKYSPSIGDYLSHLQNTAQNMGAGNDYIQALMNALAISQGKYGASNYGY